MFKCNSININVHFQHLTARTANLALVKSENRLAVLGILACVQTSPLPQKKSREETPVNCQ